MERLTTVQNHVARYRHYGQYLALIFGMIAMLIPPATFIYMWMLYDAEVRSYYRFDANVTSSNITIFGDDWRVCDDYVFQYRNTTYNGTDSIIFRDLATAQDFSWVNVIDVCAKISNITDSHFCSNWRPGFYMMIITVSFSMSIMTVVGFLAMVHKFVEIGRKYGCSPINEERIPILNS